MNGDIRYYRDRTELEADKVLTLYNDNYPLIECKLARSVIEEDVKHLLKIEKVIKENKN